MAKMDKPSVVSGSGVWPTHDWNGKKFTATYYPRWCLLAGTKLCGGWRGVLDGIQGDQDFLHKIFNFKRHSLQKNNFGIYTF